MRWYDETMAPTEDAGGKRGIGAVEFTTIAGRGEELREPMQHAVWARLREDTAEFGVTRLGDDDATQGDRLRLDHRLQQFEPEVAQHLLDRAGALEFLVEAFEEAPRPILDDLGEQAFLAAEMAIEGLLRGPRTGGDGLHRRVAEPMFEKDARGDRRNLPAALFTARNRIVAGDRSALRG